MPRQPGAQGPLDVVDLTHPIELIAGQIQQHDDRRVHRVSDVRHVHLVYFESGQRRLPRTGQRGHQPGVHVGTLGVGRHRTDRGQRRRGHPGGGRLTVCAGHDDGASAGTELTQDRTVECHRDEAADHGAGTAPGRPGRPARGGSSGQRRAPPQCHRRPGHRNAVYASHDGRADTDSMSRALSDLRAILTV